MLTWLMLHMEEKRIDGWMDGWMDRQMDGQMNTLILILNCSFVFPGNTNLRLMASTSSPQCRIDSDNKTSSLTWNKFRPKDRPHRVSRMASMKRGVTLDMQGGDSGQAKEQNDDDVVKGAVVVVVVVVCGEREQNDADVDEVDEGVVDGCSKW